MDKLLEVKNVCKKYPKFSLENVSFDVPEGSIVGFIGRNGAGKTTTLKGIMNLVHFDNGEVIAFDKKISENELEIKQNIGFSLSELNYYPNKTIKSVMKVTKRFYKNFDDERFKKICDLFDLDINKKLQDLSSGMKVKFSLSIALSYDAKLLILDEPTSGLDPVSRDEVVDIFKNIVKKEGKGILFSTHITSDLDKAATHIVYIQKGRIIYTGTKSDFVDSYFVVSGKKNILDKKMDKLISFKDVENTIQGMINANDKEIFEGLDIEIRRPDLEEIMVFLERGNKDEEFDL